MARINRSLATCAAAIGVLSCTGLADSPAIARMASRAANSPARPAKPVTYYEREVIGVPLKIVDADLTNPRVHVTVQLAEGYPHAAEPVSAMIARSRPAAAINGAYFSKEDGAPIGDIVIAGQVAYRGAFKTALVIGSDRHASIQRHAVEERVDWSQCETVLACGPGLVFDGKVDYAADAANHHDPHVTGSTQRMGVGITADQHLLLVAAYKPLSFGEWAGVMKALGCREAMNLDSGASRMLYYRGSYLTRSMPRPLTNLLLVYETPPPDRLTLAPARATIIVAAPPPIDEAPPGDPTAVSVRICADSNKRASLWCPSSVERRIRKGKVPGKCGLHRAPPGERG